MMVLGLFAFSALLGVSVVAGCGQVLSGNGGTFQSPNYPGNYPNHANCVWTITTDPGTYVTLTFSTFSLESASLCRYDSLEVRDGSNQLALRLVRACGYGIPGPVTATGNVMFIQFRSDYSVTRSGFQAQWSAVSFEECGQALTGNVGTLQSPNHPNAYDNNVRCRWTITTDPGTQVVLTISAFNIQASPGCSSDYLLIRDGNNQTSDLLSKRCGSGDPVPITAAGNVMFIEFGSDASVTFSGFLAQWSTSQGCDQALTGNAGTLQSPNYPNNYFNNAQCEWTITTDPGTQVVLEFSAFDLQDRWNCQYDSLVIRDGNNQTAPLLTRRCGSSNPAPIRATGNAMFIQLITDGSNIRSGFQAQWFAREACGEALTGNEGTLQSPNYPNSYDNHTRCVWTITTDPGTLVKLTFSAFQLQSSSICRNDYLLIRDGNNQTGSQLARRCGSTIPANITASGNVMYIQFSSDGGVTGSGFHAQWSAVQGCNQNLMDNEGTLQSPNYPGNYPNNARCVWTITTDPGTQITLTFSAFRLESHSSCRWDSLVIHDGLNRGATRLRNLCGSSIPAPVTATANEMFIEFRADSIINYRGFSAQWSTDQVTSTPNTPSSPFNGDSTTNSPIGVTSTPNTPSSPFYGDSTTNSPIGACRSGLRSCALQFYIASDHTSNIFVVLLNLWSCITTSCPALNLPPAMPSAFP